MPKNSFQETTNESLPITKDNRHQYYETEIVQASEADRQIRHAEARGRERLEREEVLKKKFKQLLMVVVAVLVLGTALLVALLMKR